VGYGRVPYFRSCATPLAAAPQVTVTIGICLRKRKKGTFGVWQSHCYGLIRSTLGRRATVAQSCCAALIVFLEGAVRMHHGPVVNPL
jgi:hypothetical protein